MTSIAPPSEKEPAVFDASPLIFFDVLGYSDQLPELHRILVPPAGRSASVPDFPDRVYAGLGEYQLRAAAQVPTLVEGDL
jgi:hypothetical protein